MAIVEAFREAMIKHWEGARRSNGFSIRDFRGKVNLLE
jgi:hypothetical protein